VCWVGDASAELTYGTSGYESTVQLEIDERALRSRLRLIRKARSSSSVDCVSVAVPCDSETFQQRGPLHFAFQWQGTPYYLEVHVSGDVSLVCRAPGSVQLLAGVGVAIEAVFSRDWSAVNVDWTLSCGCTHEVADCE